MATATLDSQIDTQISGPVYKAIVGAVEKCLSMCGCRARVVGITTVPSHEPGHVTGIIGVHGKVSGFCTVNMAERFAIKAVSGLLQEESSTLTAQVVDGVGEITNIIVGGVKGALANTAWSFPQITVPSVIVGDGYRMAFAKGLEYLCVVFEHDDPGAVMLDQRLMQVSVSLLKL